MISLKNIRDYNRCHLSIAGVHDIEAGPVTGLVCRPRQPQPLRERPLH